jgi:hypothetical protein
MRTTRTGHRRAGIIDGSGTTGGTRLANVEVQTQIAKLEQKLASIVARNDGR